ncbi:transcription factor IBH1-like [Cannabis sativa]|uniref:transcription factor IBH1-like n=1 Tax=Cannabis sativa TaxID=3483 RepID=UPI0029CA9884|nr:transcription factor IBH1-like [Cannabis sativa]
MNSQINSPNPNPNSLKNRFAKGFIRALMRIHKSPSNNNNNSPREISKRRRRIKTAANAAMASAVGSRKVLWSQAVLRKIRNNRPGSHGGSRSSRRVIFKRSIINQKSFVKKKREEEEIVGFGEDDEKKLRKVVPGGAAMDICSLLDETAHYIRCLTTQVKVMKTITEIYST